MNTGRIIVSALAASILAIPAMADAPGYFQVPGTETTLKLYGNIQLREAYGLNGNGMSDVSALGGENDSTQQRGQWNGSWRGYLGVTTTTPSSFGDVTTKINGRFKNNDGVNGQAIMFNLEQAYIQIGGFKAGTDWSLFGYGAWEPNTLFGCVADEDGAWANVRQITYIFSPVKGLDLGISLEGKNPGTTSTSPAKLNKNGSTTPAGISTGTSNGSVPNISAVIAYAQDWGGVTAAVNYQQKKDWTKAGPDASGSGTSIFLSGGWNITSNDQLTAMFLKGGEGFGSGQDGFYVEGPVAAPTGYGFYKSTAINASYTHTWNDQFSSALTVAQTKWNKDSVAQPAADFKVMEYIVNTTWQMTKTVSFGVEYQMTENKASNYATMPFTTDTAALSNKNKLDMFRFKLKANLF